MKAILIRKYGGPEVVEHSDVPVPKLTAGHILIKVEAAAMNPIDRKIRNGEMKMFVRAPLPIILGCEVAGTITEVAPDVTRLKVGDRVYSPVPGDHNGFAEYVSVPHEVAAVLPKTLDMIQSVSLPVGTITALQSLRDKGELKAGQRVLINGASGGVGYYGVQLAKELGAHVTAVCSAAKHDLVRAAGATECLDYKTADFTKLGKKWDVIFDAAGTKHFGEVRDALEPHGHYVTTISSGGDMVAPVLNPVRSQKSHFIIMKPNIADTEYVRGLVDAGKLKPFVGPVFPLAKYDEAQAVSDGGKATGKIVLSPF
jgi:NADPH:quinone reductase-like Zn-dependent oxidoreductase